MGSCARSTGISLASFAGVYFDLSTYLDAGIFYTLGASSLTIGSWVGATGISLALFDIIYFFYYYFSAYLIAVGATAGGTTLTDSTVVGFGTFYLHLDR